ncbi:addiction module killer protein [Paraneptunicella aestuarii]|uniref:type II toxin-antitoxin system RelE/ParE family toxin n=1 Tax=Paraneptunicella aestuarii TaxID=2831148 RepID=UPI001E3278F9|nr:type II toxin-antitoxin system RelE/ParE family toxin [Paraneptunicella aestuarii]UAA39924.1 addiction module killer protein [Paraneptunicella aestuarii]
MMPVVKRVAKEYQTEKGKAPFRDWLKGLRDVRAQAKITKAIKQMEAGNFGDHKALSNANGLYERRIHYGPGYRIYFIVEGDSVILLFSGSDKSDQKTMIAQAKSYLHDYQSRKESD